MTLKLIPFEGQIEIMHECDADHIRDVSLAESFIDSLCDSAGDFSEQNCRANSSGDRKKRIS